MRALGHGVGLDLDAVDSDADAVDLMEATYLIVDS